MNKSPARLLVAGASSGIGYAIAHRALADGWAVTGITRDAARLVDPVNAIELDLSKLDELAATLDSGLFRDHAFDAVVLSAGRGDFGALEQFSSARIRTLIDLNFTSQALLLRALLPAMKARRSGRVVVIGSEAALDGRRNGAIYCASKFALRGLTQALREECAPAGIAVTIVNPGMVDTPFFNDLDFAPGKHANNAIKSTDIADAVATVLSMRAGTVVDELNLSPLKHVVRSTR